MACPKCGCKTTYQYNDHEVRPSEGLERCAACGCIFDLEDSVDDEDDDEREVVAVRVEIREVQS